MTTTRRRFFACCGGDQEHFDWCSLGVELAHLDRSLKARGVVAEAQRVLADADDWDLGDEMWDGVKDGVQS